MRKIPEDLVDQEVPEIPEGKFHAHVDLLPFSITCACGIFAFLFGEVFIFRGQKFQKAQVQKVKIRLKGQI